MCWLQPNIAHDVHEIPAALRPGVGLTGDMTSNSVFNETVFVDLLTRAALEQGDEHLMLTGFVGQRLKMAMSQWLGKATTVTGLNNVLMRTEPKAKKIELICDEFAYDGVSVRTLVCNHLGCDMPSNGAAITRTDKQFYSGAFVRPEFWSIDTLMPMRTRRLENKGGGERGFHEAILRLACRNPLGQFAVVHAPAA
jgi:Rieske Fe-S protein